MFCLLVLMVKVLITSLKECNITLLNFNDEYHLKIRPFLHQISYINSISEIADCVVALPMSKKLFIRYQSVRRLSVLIKIHLMTDAVWCATEIQYMFLF